MKHELLVPVGNKESLIAAINGGADAVYLGGKLFGARAYADNFTISEIEDATKLCHLYGVKIYITVNTLIYEKEINTALDYIEKLSKIGVDALIMQDIGLINLVHQTYPNLEIHASTQMHNHSKESIEFLKDLGVKRIVFARELPLNYINDIDTELEKEVFIHGALCVSYSGQCLFSSLILNRSGNRGECAGMCRLPYKLMENEKEIAVNGDYLLSPKDLCTFTEFKKLMDSNVKCFKIEGRMKSPQYVYMVTKMYHKLMEQYERNEELKIDSEDFMILNSIYNREYTKGYLFNDNDIMNFSSPNHKGISIGKVTNVTKKKITIKLEHDLKQFEGIRFKESNIGIKTNFIYDKNNNLINMGKKREIIYIDNFVNLKTLDEVLLTNPKLEIDNVIIKKIPISMKIELKINKPIKIEVDDYTNKVSIESDILAEKSIKWPVSKERVEASLLKTGNTPFIIDNLNTIMDDNVFVPVSIINELRRKILLNLKDIRENKRDKEFVKLKYNDYNLKKDITNNINVLVRTEEQLKACKDLKITNIIVKNSNMMNENLIYKVPRDNIKHVYSYKKLLVTDYASLYKYPGNISDYSLNITNHYSLNYLSRYAKSSMLSLECKVEDIKDIMQNYHNNINVEVMVYGYAELMIMKYCPLNKIVNKDKICHVCQNNKKYYLKDRNNSLYRLENNIETHSTSLLNYKKVNLCDKIATLKSLGITNYRIELLDENYEETMKIIERVKENL